VLGDGKPYYALGFRIGDISYISDTSKLPEKAKIIIKGSRLVVMDALRTKPHVSHFSYDQSIEALTELMALDGQGYFTGLTHELDHDDIDKYIKSKTPLNIRCAFDGMKLVLN
jgi:phosphoribosyl 1,2-cyclic phosphodiesterase